MEWSERMSSAIDYIEENLSEEIDPGKAAQKACCSAFHFQRMFMMVTGVTLAEYIRRRRLTLAAMELSSGKEKVVDIAVKYGYDSPDAFTRAFRNVHGITPQAAREPGVTLVAYPRISFQIVLKGGNDMDYCIQHKPAFEVIARVREFTTIQNENFVKIPKFWNEFNATEEAKKLYGLLEAKQGPVTGKTVLGICIGDVDAVNFKYGIGIEKASGKSLEGFETIRIPEETWAVFDSIGPMPDALQDVTRKIFSEWFPSTGFEHASAPELEVYPDGDLQGKNYHCQVWIPVIKKK